LLTTWIGTLKTGLRVSAKNPVNFFARTTLSALPFVGLVVEIPNLYVRIVTGLASVIVSITAARYISKFSVPQALAIGYFKSFVEPIGRALKTGAGEIEYDDGVSEGKIRMKLDPRKINASLKIVLPKDLSVGDKPSGTGPDEYQQAINPKAVGDIYLPTRKKPYTVHLEVGNVKDLQRLVLFDMPTALYPLSQILWNEEPKQSTDREKRAKIALQGFSKQLDIERAKLRSELGEIDISNGQSLLEASDFKTTP